MLNQAAQNIEQLLSKEFAPFPKYGEAGWQQLSAEAKETILSGAEELLEKEWPSLLAVRYMDFQRNGNRSNYEGVYFERRDRLFRMMAAECVEGKGRFIDQIINGIWLICEESSWVVPAHNPHHKPKEKRNEALPDCTRELPYIDLFAAETAALLSWICYFLRDRLDQESDLICKRIEKEIAHRIFEPFLYYSDMNWMGLHHSRPVNNWNPWISSNVLNAILIMDKDEERRIAGLKKIARCAQRFLDFYAEDGGCDEGPSYFNAAGASMLDVLELFYDATDGKLSLYDKPLIGNMADYIRHVYIDGAYFVNFADAPCSISNVSAGCLIRAGKLTGKDRLSDFGRTMYREGLAVKPWDLHIGRHNMLYRKLKALFTFKEEDFAPLEPLSSDAHYFAGIQVAAARTKDNLFFAAKGGNNAESHNHNDVGSYILYAKGQPCAIDAGVGRYSKKTFDERRYTIWSMRSSYHNTAIINGLNQLHGREFAAHSAEYCEDGAVVRFALNLENAYAPAAAVTAFRRSFELDRDANELTVTDSLTLSKAEQPTQLPVMCYLPPVIEEGCARINGITLHFDPALFTASYEEISLDDEENPITCWKKDTLYRLLLTRTEAKTEDQWTLRYTLN